MSSSRSIKYRKDIDGLRALAVLFVLIFHFDLFSLGEGGLMGVDIFFVISGFLITSIVKTQLDQGTFSFRVFYTRRIQRLAPALFVVIFSVMLVGSLTLFPDRFVGLVEQFAATQFYFSNIYFWQTIDYFGFTSGSVHLLHTWSLAVEEQFYLFFPLTMFLIYRYAKAYLWHLILLGIVISFALNLYFIDIKPELTFYLMPTRAWELLCGSVLVWLLSFSLFSKTTSNILGYLGMAILLFAVLNFDSSVSFPGYYALYPSIGSMLLILSGNNATSLLFRVFKNNAVVYVGKLSYPLYLVHWPINVFAHDYFKQGYDLPWRFAMFGLSFLCAMVLYHYIEKPFRTGYFQHRTKRLISMYIAGLVSSLAIFGLVSMSDGLPGRFPKEVIKIAGYVNDNGVVDLKCLYDGQQLTRPDDFCRIGKPGINPNWILIGDSHARAIKEAFHLWLNKTNQSGLFMYRYSCPPLEDVYLIKNGGRCYDFNTKALSFIKENDAIQNIVLASTWLQPITGDLTDESGKELRRVDAINLFKTQFSHTLQYLKSLDKNIIIWEPVPGAKDDVPSGLARAKLEGRHATDLIFSRQEYQARYQYFFSALEKNKPLIDTILSPSEVLCATGTCSIELEGVPLYIDNAHLTFSSQPYWSRVLELQLNRNE